jgi:hypothetical protein
MATSFPDWRSEHGRVAALSRSRSPDDPALIAARRALGLARTEDSIRRAIESAPPLDADALARIRALIPALPTDAGANR